MRKEHELDRLQGEMRSRRLRREEGGAKGVLLQRRGSALQQRSEESATGVMKRPGEVCPWPGQIRPNMALQMSR